MRIAEKRRGGLPLLVLPLVFMLSGCGRESEEGAAVDEAEPARVTMAFSRSSWSTLVLVALDKGYFEKRAVTVDRVERDSGKACLEALLSGEAELATVADMPLMEASLAGESFTVIASILRTFNHGRVVARADRGISSVEDLPGKRVGLPAGTSAEFFLHSQLNEHGVNPSTVETVDIETPGLVEALEAGTVDAISTWEPHIHRALSELGERAVALEESRSYRSTFNLVARGDPAYPDDVLQRILRALIEAEQFVLRNPEEARSIVAGSLDMDRGYLDSIWDDYEYAVFLDKGLVLTLEREARWKLDAAGRSVRAVPDYGEYMHPAPLQAVAPERMTVE